MPASLLELAAHLLDGLLGLRRADDHGDLAHLQPAGSVDDGHSLNRRPARADLAADLA